MYTALLRQLVAVRIGRLAETGESSAEDNKDSEQLDSRSSGGENGASPAENVVAEIEEASQAAVTTHEEDSIVNI